VSEGPDGILLWFEGVGSFVLDAPGRRIVATGPAGDRPTWEHRLLGFALPMLLGELGSIVVHGSAVATEDGAYLLCGPSGRGKTTTSLGLVDAGATLLSDDITVVHDRGAPHVWPGPRGSRVLGSDGEKSVQFLADRPPELPVALRGVVVLGPRGAEFRLRRHDPADGFVALVPHVTAITSLAWETMIHGTADLARRLPVYAVTMPDRLAALPAAARALLDGLQ
jgi:hypothetical protein